MIDSSIATSSRWDWNQSCGLRNEIRPWDCAIKEGLLVFGFVSVVCILCSKKRLLISQTRCYGISEGFALCSHQSFVITESKWWILITWLTEIYQRVNEPWGGMVKGKSTRLRTAPTPFQTQPLTSIPPKFIPFKNRPNRFHIFSEGRWV